MLKSGHPTFPHTSRDEQQTDVRQELIDTCMHQICICIISQTCQVKLTMAEKDISSAFLCQARLVVSQMSADLFFIDDDDDAGGGGGWWEKGRKKEKAQEYLVVVVGAGGGLLLVVVSGQKRFDLPETSDVVVALAFAQVGIRTEYRSHFPLSFPLSQNAHNATCKSDFLPIFCQLSLAPSSYYIMHKICSICKLHVICCMQREYRVGILITQV